MSIAEGEFEAPCFNCDHMYGEHWRRGAKRGQCKEIGTHHWVVVLRTMRPAHLTMRDDGTPCPCQGYVYLP